MSRSNSDWIAVSSAESDEISAVLPLYGLEKKAEITKNIAGGANKIYRIQTPLGTYVLRKSHMAARGAQNPATRHEHCLLQAEISTYVRSQGFMLIPQVHQNIYHEFVTKNDHGIWMLFDCASGRRCGNWGDGANISDAMFESFFESLGKFHSHLFMFTTQIDTADKNVFDFALESQEWLVNLIPMLPENIRVRLQEQLPELELFINTTINLLRAVDYPSLPKQIVHFDFHYGNVYFKDNAVSAILDLDWTRLDSRLTDFAAAIFLTAPYTGPERGKIDARKAMHALTSYRNGFGQVDKDELAVIEATCRAYVFFQFLYGLEHYVRDQLGNEDELSYMLSTIFDNDFSKLFSEEVYSYSQ